MDPVVLNPVPWAVPAFVLLVLAEMAWAHRRAPQAYEPRDTLTSLLLGFGNVVVTLLGTGLVYALASWLYQYRLVTIGWQWWAWAACVVLDDFNYYWFHRSAHRVRWFWAAHVNHHTSQHYNLSTALRQTWTDLLALGFAFRVWPALLGFHPAMILAVGGFNLIYQFWIHTETIGRLPRVLEAVLNTPSHHRVHHAVNPAYLDRNYAGMFIVWDRLFGTFQPELAGERARYGIVRQLGSFSLLWSAFHEWAGIAADLWRAPWRYKLSYVWRVPGWSHDATRDTTDMIRGRWRAREQERALQ